MKLEQSRCLERRKSPSESQRTVIVQFIKTQETSVCVNTQLNRIVRKDLRGRSELRSQGHPRSRVEDWENCLPVRCAKMTAAFPAPSHCLFPVRTSKHCAACCFEACLGMVHSAVQ